MRFIFVILVLSVMCFGQTLRDLEAKAEKYGVDNANKFFSHDQKYLDAWNKKEYILGHIDTYKEFVNIEIINVLEGIATSKKRMDYATFVKKHRGEPNISEDRIRNFRETGYYIDEYEKYVNK